LYQKNKGPKMDNPFEVLESRLDNIEKLLIEIKQNSPSDSSVLSPPDHWMNIDQFRAYIPQGWSRATVYSKTGKGEFPFHKRGKKLMFLKSEIDTWLRQGKRKSSTEARSEAEKLIKDKA